ncbi:Reverse transcriptase domain, partial [Trinorchestia longiramus]
DMITDLNAESEPLPMDTVKDDWQGHKGMVQAAVYIRTKLREELLLEKAFARDPDRGTNRYDLVLVGHSLGAGTAAILAILLKQHYSNLSCFAYSPPGGLLSKPVLEFTKEFITSVVVGKDVVPRIGLHQMETLRADLITAIQHSQEPKWKTITSTMQCCGSGAPSVTADTDREEVGQWSSSRRKMSRNPASHPLDASIELTVHRPLYPPGRILHVVRHHPDPGRHWKCNPKPVYQAVWVDNEDFGEVIISPCMIQDHMPDKVLEALELNNPRNQTNTRNTPTPNKIPTHLLPSQETRTLSSLVPRTCKPQTPKKTHKRMYSATWNHTITNIKINDNPKQFWSSIRRMSSNNTKQSTPYIKLNDTYYHSPSDKEPLFRTHWSNIYSGIDDPDNKFDENLIHDVETRMTNITPRLKPHEIGDITRLNTPQFPAITLQELKQALRTFSQKAPGHTKISTHQLKQLSLNMLQYLLYIFNNAISARHFPIKLKHAIMIFLPIPSTSQHEIKNYCPISLLDIHGKLLDKILTYRLTDHLTIHNIYNKRQHGFRHGRGTHTALATLHETLHIHLNQRHTIDVILRDVSKAFDKVWHTGLKYKLSQLNLDPLFTKVLTNFLSDRTASIRIANHTGQPFPIKSGVPQGAVISPALYSFYTHDLPPPIPNTDYIAFADDITQITFSPNSHNMAARLTSRAIA